MSVSFILFSRAVLFHNPIIREHVNDTVDLSQPECTAFLFISSDCPSVHRPAPDTVSGQHWADGAFAFPRAIAIKQTRTKNIYDKHTYTRTPKDSFGASTFDEKIFPICCREMHLPWPGKMCQRLPSQASAAAMRKFVVPNSDPLCKLKRWCEKRM